MTRDKWLIFLATVLAFGLPIVAGGPFDSLAEEYGYGLRVTARVAVTCFLLAYIARPLVQTMGIGRWLVRRRRYLGLAAALTHTVHFGYVIAHELVSKSPADLLTWVFGGMAFVLFWVMAATSNDTSVKMLGPWWRRLHRFGMHYIWFIFFYTYLGVAAYVGGAYWAYPVLLVAALVLRVVAYAKRRGQAKLEASAA